MSEIVGTERANGALLANGLVAYVDGALRTQESAENRRQAEQADPEADSETIGVGRAAGARMEADLAHEVISLKREQRDRLDVAIQRGLGRNFDVSA